MRNIPNNCHFIWTNKSPLSWLQTLSVISFHRYNPTWKINLFVIKQTPDQLAENTYVEDYTGEDHFELLARLNYVNITYLDLIHEGIGTDKHGILASDILRVRLLYKYGGVYSDLDTLWLRPMSEFKNIKCIGNPEDFETTACFFELTHGHHNNSNIISEQEGNYLRAIIEEQDKIKPPYVDYQTFNTSLLNRMFPVYESIISRFPRVIAMDYKTLYPYSTFQVDRLFVLEDMFPLDSSAALGVHWFNGNRLSKIYVNSGQYFPCSMTTILKREGYL